MTKKYAFIGAGHMAGALVFGLAEKCATPASDIMLYDTWAPALEKFAALTPALAGDTADAVAFGDYVFLAVRPQDFDEMLGNIKGCGVPLTGKVFVTIAAGVPVSAITDRLGEVAVVRVMPNTPLMIGMGASALCRNAAVSDGDFSAIRDIFAALGGTVVLDEKDMNAIISVNGSSPAYVYLLIDAIYKSALAQGIDAEPDALLSLVCDTVIGSAALLKSSGKSPGEQLAAVCSKGGTTEAAVGELLAGDLYGTLDRAMKACTRRAFELGRK